MTGERLVGSRRWLRVSLRGALLLLTVLCVLLGIKASRVHRQKLSVARVQELGGLVAFDHDMRAGTWSSQPSGPPLWLTNILGEEWFRKFVLINFDEGSDPTDDDLALLQDLPDVREITLFDRNRITDEGLVHLGRLKHLEKLPLHGTGVRGPGLRHFTSQKLTLITLQDTPFTDEGMVYLANKASLQYLNLSGTEITDDGLSALVNLPSLTRLEINWTAISDKGLSHLARLTSLTQLFVRGTNTTETGRAKLQKSLPKCKISS